MPYAALLHDAHDDVTRKAHLVLEDLSGSTVGWDDLGEPERAARAPDVARLVARFHGAWLTRADLARSVYGDWDASREAARARRSLARALPAGADLPSGPLETARRLGQDGEIEAVLAEARLVGLAHGDLHFQQVLWAREGEEVFLLDYQHVRPAPLGLDLAHLLAVRLGWLERRALAAPMLAAYREDLRAAGVPVTNADLAREWRVGLALNFAGLWGLYARDPSDLFRDLLLRSWYALEESADVTVP